MRNIFFAIFYFFSIVISCLSNNILAQEMAFSPLKKVTLLISILNSEKEANIFQKNAEFIAKKFHQKFSPDFETRVIFQAVQADLYNALNDSQNAGVFWVSHAGGENSTFESTSVTGQIIDAEGADVSSIFTRIHPNIRWLGVIGCKALPILENLVKEKSLTHEKSIYFYNTGWRISGLFQADPLTEIPNNGLVIAATNQLALASHNALTQFSAAARFFRQHSVTQEETSEVNQSKNKLYRLEIKRKKSKNNLSPFASSQILINNKIIYVFPIGYEDNESVTVDIEMKYFTTKEKKNLTLVVKSGKNASSDKPPHLGQFTFQIKENPDLKWKQVMLGNKPLGVNQHIYKFGSGTN